MLKRFLKNLSIFVSILTLVLFVAESPFYYNFYWGEGWQSPEPKPTGDYVILFHGIRASAGAMDNIARFLDEKGYTVINIDYPSSQYEIATLAENYFGPALENCCDGASKESGRKIHIVTHSMGGIVLRQYLQNHSIKNLGKIVMIAPPNHGSIWSDLMGDWKIAEWIMGPALAELKTGDQGVPENLPIPATEFAIIAGENDNKVSVESAKLEGMADFKVVPNNHINILRSKEMMEAVGRFLQDPYFNRS